ncbi:class I SAM-dependent methyltransferase [Alicyclobacillus ferrooxydans]|uniref:Methyltransferase domain-containing protein n=1 Tax=Alicyclobacillus ferrooxydans TaxID=471514 RepID=A0A0P9CD32_9BACL|nr:class I SAM-dependent methyltransferase [Alicyclobacillus ferrooxydans]KPV40777.1 hypothetical protein AN477_20890 [Alicyclobacillus ferrooxydans]
MRIPNFKTDAGAMRYKDTVGTFIAPEVAKFVIEIAQQHISQGAKRVLDVACGPGTVSLRVAQQNPNADIVGADYSAAMIRQCVQSSEVMGLQNTQFVEMNANDIRFDGPPFDLIVCNLAFPFFSKPAESMKGLYDSVAASGHVVLSVPGNETWSEFFVIAEDVLGDAIQMAKPFLIKMEQASKLPAAMTEAGFRDIRVSRHKLPYTFSTGHDVLAFFNELFALLSYAPPLVQAEIASAIDTQCPNGFTMHYEAVIVEAIK